MTTSPLLIDGLQFCHWSRTVFEQMHEAGLAAVHVTVAYHESFRKTVEHIADWNARLREHADLIVMARGTADIDRARATGRTAILFGLQNPLPLEDDLGLVQILHALGVRFMQLTYNNQSLLGSGWQEPHDGGLTRMGRLVVAEMNRLGFVIDMSHGGERTTLDVLAASTRPIAITHANAASWCATGRNVSPAVLDALARNGGMLGLSLYPMHLRDGSQTTLADFCAMARAVADVIGADNLGIGSDLCQDQPDSIVRWMREGRWMPPTPGPIVFPPQPAWFQDNRDFPTLAKGFADAGFAPDEVAGIMGGNWYRFMGQAFAPVAASPEGPR